MNNNLVFAISINRFKEELASISVCTGNDMYYTNIISKTAHEEYLDSICLEESKKSHIKGDIFKFISFIDTWSRNAMYKNRNVQFLFKNNEEYMEFEHNIKKKYGRDHVIKNDILFLNPAITFKRVDLNKKCPSVASLLMDLYSESLEDKKQSDISELLKNTVASIYVDYGVPIEKLTALMAIAIKDNHESNR